MYATYSVSCGDRAEQKLKMTCPKRSFKVGKYSLYEKLGVGGFGIVRKAINDEDGSIVAIKILDKTELQLHEMTEHVKKEVTLLTMLKHPNIVKGYEVLNSKTKLFLVMEYVDGGDMHTVLSTKIKFSEAEAQRYFRSLIKCLHYCHERGVYHRDLKLENLLLTSSGELKVCDFGLASVRALNSDKSDLCQTIVGTEDFSPPEVLRNIPYNGGKSDMWSAGILLFAMLAGYCPFQGRSPRELHQRILSCKYSFPRNFPEQPKKIIKRLLVAKEADRLSAVEVLQCEWMLDSAPKSLTDFRLLGAPPTSPTTPASVGEVIISSEDSESSAESPSTNGTSLTTPEKCFEQKRSATMKKHSSSGIYENNYQETQDDDEVPKKSHRGTSNIAERSLYLALARTNVPGFVDMYDAMRDGKSGISVADRRWRWKSFPVCFVGADAVTWIASYLACTREEAAQVGQRLLEAGVFHHVCREHDFEDAFLFYRFLDDEPENTVVLNLRVAFRRTIPCPDPVSTSHALLSQLLSICRMHQSVGGCRAIDISGIQRDPIFQAYLSSVCELQVLDIDLIVTDDQRVSFLVNVCNLMWIQARIHIGDYHRVYNTNLKSKALSFQYNLAGASISLLEIEQILLSSRNASCSKKEDNIERGLIGSSVFARLIAGKKNAQKIRENLRPESFDPWRIFLISDASLDSPLVRATSEKDINIIHIRQAAAEYLAFTLEVDVDAGILTHSTRVERFRKAASISDNETFVELLADLCTGLPVEAKLRKMQVRSTEQNFPIIILIREESTTFSYSWETFAPRIASHASMESNDSSPWMT